jgi:hypothetical protein
MLFFWAWRQPSFDTDDIVVLSKTRSPNAGHIIAQERWHSARAITGLLLLASGCVIQLGLVWTDKRTA